MPIQTVSLNPQDVQAPKLTMGSGTGLTQEISVTPTVSLPAINIREPDVLVHVPTVSPKPMETKRILLLGALGLGAVYLTRRG